MTMQEPNSLIPMDAESFERLTRFVTREYGIKLPLSKKPMLESRLNRQVKLLGASTYKNFLDIIFSDQGKREHLLHVIDLITTNKTDFFREAAHFRFLSEEFLPEYSRKSSSGSLKIWSAGCSTGEEPYTIIMMMEELKKRITSMTYNLLATDVSIRALQTAHQGIYDLERIDPVPVDLKKAYFLRGKTAPTVVRVKPEFRKRVQFSRLNLMDDDFGLGRGELDLIFCRNVLIYFDKNTQQKVIEKFCHHLKPGGLLLLGHSESTVGMNVPLKQVRPTVYQFEG
jgi:chemotaxis protein methyltransferase CheR